MIEYTKEEIIQNRLLWEESLASGNYAKGQDALRQGDEYCCLGLASELLSIGSEIIDVHQSKDGVYHYDYSCATAPHYVVDGLGLNNAVGAPNAGLNIKPLAYINDTSDTFKPVLEAIQTGNYYKDLNNEN